MGKTQARLFSAIPVAAQQELARIRAELVEREQARAANAKRARLLRAADERETWEQFQQGCTRLKGR